MKNKFRAANTYDDIINLPHHVSKTRPQMGIIDRAAQFSPFMALTGYGDAVEETARLTDDWIELDEERKALLNKKLQIICEHISEKPIAAITFFQPDEKKDGGAYVTITGSVKRVDEYNGTVIMTDKTEIEINRIQAMESKLFDGLEFI
ncbi:MAG: hypothetical protein J1F01_09055 [Oscillospiraceae bacterium]|nr:hypothetical protein [Oscillospiraceae bacterium]